MKQYVAMGVHHIYGKVGEDRAVAYLTAEGFTVIERNWRLGHKEIDVICMEGDMLVIVEVKTRATVVEYPEELLDYKKKQNLLRAGEAYIKMHGIRKELRFDLVIVTGADYKVTHIREAIQVFD